jgi:hypothetical protein
MNLQCSPSSFQQSHIRFPCSSLYVQVVVGEHFFSPILMVEEYLIVEKLSQKLCPSSNHIELKL